MEKIGGKLKPQTLEQQRKSQELIQTILADPDVVSFIKKFSLSSEEVNRSLSKFNQYCNERQKFQQSANQYSAKGYQPVLVMNEGYADVAYVELPEHREAMARQEARNRIQLIGMPGHLKDISEKDLAMDPNRVDIYQFFQNYIQRLDDGQQKGLYLYGNFGVGKSYLLAYLANRLSTKYGKRTTILHFPTFTVDIKDAINDNDKSVKEQIDRIKKVDILVLDDIGAEKNSPWIRDDVLQVILQHRMQEDLLTFFTSNLDFKGLERHLATTGNRDETWQAQRIMERIRYLSKELHLKGENRR